MFAHERTRTAMKSSYFAQVCMSGTFLLSSSHFPSRNFHFLSVTNTNSPIFISQTILRINSFFFFKVLLSLLLAASKNHHSTAFFFFATVTQDEEINSGCKAQCQEISPAYATELRGSRNTPVCFGQRVIYFAACFSTTKNAAFTSQLIVNSWKHLMWKI